MASDMWLRRYDSALAELSKADARITEMEERAKAAEERSATADALRRDCEGRLAEILLATGIDAPIDTIGPLEVAEHFASLQANVESVGATCAANALDRYKAERRAKAAEERVAQAEDIITRAAAYVDASPDRRPPNSTLPPLSDAIRAWLAGPGKEQEK